MKRAAALAMALVFTAAALTGCSEVGYLEHQGLRHYHRHRPGGGGNGADGEISPDDRRVRGEIRIGQLRHHRKPGDQFPAGHGDAEAGDSKEAESFGDQC